MGLIDISVKKMGDMPEDTKLPPLFEIVTTHDFSDDVCFLCGIQIIRGKDGNGSDEHVFPRWLQHRFNLWDKTITLLNGTPIPYRNLKIPCCSTCNNNYLSEIETQVQKAFDAGYEAFSNLNTHILFLWTAKIYYGLLYRELSLLVDRSKPDLGTIISKEDMTQFRTMHIFLQSARVPVVFHCFHADFPASIFTFRLQESDIPEAKFDFKDDVLYSDLYLQLGSIGLIAAFDTGAQAFEGKEFFSKYQPFALHPIQFKELGANLFYKSRLLNRIPKLITAANEDHYIVTVMPLAGLSSKPVFDVWDNAEYAKVLEFFTAMPRHMLHSEGKVWTCLRTPDGEIKSIDIQEFPYP